MRRLDKQLDSFGTAGDFMNGLQLRGSSSRERIQGGEIMHAAKIRCTCSSEAS